MDKKRRFAGTRKISIENNSSVVRKSTKSFSRLVTHIPPEILQNEELNQALRLLPSNYNFEVHKTVWNVRKNSAKRVALQMPEGLLIYAPILSDIISSFCECEVIIMGDVSYGACCIDDFSARNLDCDYIIHYAHSCLVPIDVTKIKVLYVFVTIGIDSQHLQNTITKNFATGSHLAIFGTIQFNPTIHQLTTKLEDYQLTTPQIAPLSKGEVLGCTLTRLDADDVDAMIYIGDGRFHLESSMIHNPQIPSYRYDPYSRKFTREYYDFNQLKDMRTNAIKVARQSQKFGVILGALGRQGNNQTLKNIENVLKLHGKLVVKIILSEIFPMKLAMFDDIDCFVQVACPRLSIDWGYAFNKPLLTPYELNVSFEKDVQFSDYYPMDYYATDGYGRGKIPQRS